MGRKKVLEKRLQRLQQKKKDLAARALASDSADEVRSINAQIEDINADLAEVQEELDAIAADEQRSANDEQRSENPPENARLVNGRVMGSFTTPEQRSENPLASLEYRSAFRAYYSNGTPIPAEFRDAINTSDHAVIIPHTVMQVVINTIRQKRGGLYSRVRKTSVRGGVEYPIGALQASFKWINEGTVSPRQNVGKLGSVVFKYNVGEIRVARTFLSDLLGIDAFEQEIGRLIGEAYLEAMDAGIVSGSGSGSMLGILNDPRVTNEVVMTAAEMGDWTKWRTKFFKKLPLSYRSGEFVFPVSTVDEYLETMADSNKNPVFKEATGLEIDEATGTGRFFGRHVECVEPDVIPDFDAAAAGDVVGLYWQPQQYAINENYGFQAKRYFDEETNEWVNKVLVVVDGRVLDPSGFVKIIKG